MMNLFLLDLDKHRNLQEELWFAVVLKDFVNFFELNDDPKRVPVAIPQFA